VFSIHSSARPDRAQTAWSSGSIRLSDRQAGGIDRQFIGVPEIFCKSSTCCNKLVKSIIEGKKAVHD
jgi:hypothetical protein